jgi:hypothetical protein
MQRGRVQVVRMNAFVERLEPKAVRRPIDRSGLYASSVQYHGECRAEGVFYGGSSAVI